MKKSIIIILFFSCLELYSQGNKIDSFSFQFSEDVYVRTNSNIQLLFEKEGGKKNVNVYAKVDGKDFKTQVSLRKYNEICEKLINLKPLDIINDAPFLLDANSTEIKFSINRNSVVYKVSGLSKGDKKTNLNDFLEVTILILDSVDLQVHNLNLVESQRE